MNVFARVHDRIVDALCALQRTGELPGGLDLAGLEVVAPPRTAARGDLVSNAALVLAKAARMPPRDIALRLAARLRGDPDIEAVEAAGPGFLNLRFAPTFWHGVLATMLKEGDAYGRVDLGRGERICVAVLSAGPSEPFAAGDGRALVLADALASLLVFAGYRVTRVCCIDGAVTQGQAPAGVAKSLADLGIVPDVLLLPGRPGGAAMEALHRPAAGCQSQVVVLGAGRVGDLVGGGAAACATVEPELILKACQPARLHRAGEPVRLSLREVLDEIGRDALRFLLLCRRPEAALELDLAQAVDQSKANPVFHVQYAHARAKSIFRNARELFPTLQEGAAEVLHSDLSRLSACGELDLIRQLAHFPALVEEAARAREPHRLAVYLYDLASSFHGNYAPGNDLPHLRSIQPADGTLTAARLALVQAVAYVLDAGLALLGVFAPLEMR